MSFNGLSELVIIDFNLANLGCFMSQETGDRRVIVQKYGGTSVGSIEKIQAIAARVKELQVKNQQNVALVVSAMAGETNRLVGLVEGVNNAASKSHYDMALAAGEQVSAALMAAALERVGLKARAFLGYQLGILTDASHARARIHSIDTSGLKRCFESDTIPVIAGFQGVSPSGDITTLGRGGSDTSAVALAVALKADYCEINTDVAGVFTADPRIVPNARLINELDCEVALEMASLGSKVLHSRCVELAAKYKMPLVVRDSFNSELSERTYIVSQNEQKQLEAPVVSAVTVDRNVARVSIDNLPVAGQVFSDLFRAIAKAGINVDIIIHDRSKIQDEAGVKVGFTIELNDLDRALDFLSSYTQSMHPPVKIETQTGLAKISVVGLGMRSHPGVAADCFELLETAGIHIAMVSTSEIKISCVIADDRIEEAAKVLHEGFIEKIKA